MHTVAVGGRYMRSRAIRSSRVPGLYIQPFVLLLMLEASSGQETAPPHHECYALECVGALLLLVAVLRGRRPRGPVFAVWCWARRSCRFKMPTGRTAANGVRASIRHGRRVKSSTWHRSDDRRAGVAVVTRRRSECHATVERMLAGPRC